MTVKEWTEQYKRLTDAFGKDHDQGQFDTYYGILKDYGVASIDYAVTVAIRINTKFPRVAELVVGTEEHRRAHTTLPATACDVCNGDKFTVTFCDGKMMGGQHGDDHRPLVAVNPDAGYVCARDFPHAKHEDAHPCWQCHPLGIKRRQESAASQA